MIMVQELPGKLVRWRNQYFPRYVFIHINKTAGSSIERALNLRFEHKTAIEKRRELGERRWTRAFKFAFVRNPWDRVVSHYYYRVKTNQTGLGDRHLGFVDWVRAAYEDRDERYRDQDLMFMQQVDWLSDEEGNLIVNFIGRFERLLEDFDLLTTKLGLTVELDHLKASGRGHYRDYYDDRTASCVQSAFRRDIEKFGYKF